MVHGETPEEQACNKKKPVSTKMKGAVPTGAMKRRGRDRLKSGKGLCAIDTSNHLGAEVSVDSGVLCSEIRL